jgi:two-component flavin-dependent monooxygenase
MIADARPGPLTRAAAAAAAACAPLAAAADRDARLSDTARAAIREAGFCRHFAPARHGGTDGTFTDCLHAAALLAAADPAAAWCASLAAAAARMAAFLPAAGQQDLWRDGPDTLITATLQPAGTARPAPGGWHADGQWPFATSASVATWALLSCRVPGGEPVCLLVPRQDWDAEDDWDSTGMRATASGTLTLPRTHVPATRAFPRQALLDGSPPAPGASPRPPHDAVSGLAFAAPLLGATRAAIGAWSEAARRRAWPPGAEDHARLTLARAAGEADAAALLLERAAACADQPPMTALDAARCRRDYWLAASLLTTAASRLFTTAGTRATSAAGPLARLWRDISTAAVHPALQPQPAASEWAARALDCQTGSEPP